MSNTEWIAYKQGYSQCYNDILSLLRQYKPENTTIEDAIDIIVSDKYIKDNKI